MNIAQARRAVLLRLPLRSGVENEPNAKLYPAEARFGSVNSACDLTVRLLKSSDIPILQQYAEHSGFEYPNLDDSSIEAILVVADDSDKPILTVAGKRLIELFAWINPEAGAELRIEAIQMIEKPMTEALKRLGYECAEMPIPPKLERRGFGRFLTKHLGCYRNWPSFGKRL